MQSSKGKKFIKEERMLKGYGNGIGPPNMCSCYVMAQDFVACCSGVEMEEFEVEDCELKWKRSKSFMWT